MRGRLLIALIVFAGAAIALWQWNKRGGSSVVTSEPIGKLAGEPLAPEVGEREPGLTAAAVMEDESAAQDNREPRLDGRTLRGRVLSSDGTPVSGALVRWLVLEKEDTELTAAWPVASWGAAPRRTVDRRTAADGAFWFPREACGVTPFGSVILAQHPEHLLGGADLGASPTTWPGEVVIRLGLGTPIDVLVVDENGEAVPEATVHHAGVPRLPDPGAPSPLASHERFLFQEALTDGAGRARLTAFRGEQALWAEHGERVSVPWQGPQPTQVLLRLGESFTVGGTITLPDWTAWDPEYVGERRILVAGQEGNLWRPLVRLRDVGAGSWGPLRIPLGDAGSYSVRLEGIPIIPLEERFEPPAPGTHRRIDFVAQRGNDTSIIALDESEQPVTSARAVAWWGNAESPTSPRRVEGSARPDGRIYLGSFPERTVRYEVSAPGYSSHYGTALASYSFPVTLVRGGRLIGCCRHSGEPVRDFEVVYWMEGKTAASRSRAFLGHDDGRFTLDDLTPGEWSVQATSPAYPLGRPMVVRVRAEATTEVELELPDAMAGRGRVVAADSGEPLAGALVQPYSTGGIARVFPWGPPTVTGPDGIFELAAFVVGTNHLAVHAEGFARTDVRASVSTQHFLDWGEIRLPRPQSLQISLTGLEELAQLSPLDMRLSTMEDMPFPERYFEADGSIRYEDVPPGDHRVFLNYPDDTWTRVHLKLDPHEEWRFALRVGGERRLRIRVLDETGEPVPPYTTVLVSGQEEDGLFLVRMKDTLEDGFAAFEGVRATTVQVWVMREGRKVASRDVTFGAEAAIEATIRIGDKPLRLRVLDSDGAPLAGAWAIVRSTDGRSVHGTDNTDAEGWAELFGVPRGAALLDLTHGIAGRRQGTPFDASIDAQEFVLEAAGSLELRIRDGVEPLPGVAVRLETAAGVSLDRARPTDERGAVRFDPLGEGAYVFGCRRADCWPVTLALDLDREQQAVREVPMRRLADLELTLRSAEGFPIAEVEITLRSLEFEIDVADWLHAERVRAPLGLRTDSLGVLRIAGLPRGPYAWSVPADKTSGGTLELVPGAANRVAVQLASR